VARPLVLCSRRRTGASYHSRTSTFSYDAGVWVPLDKNEGVVKAHFFCAVI
jgi:hypothetical protein